MNSQTMTFFAIGGETTTFEKAKFVVLPVPYEETTSYEKGTGFGPHAILHASSQVELYDEELGIETWKCGIHTLPHFPTDGNPDRFFQTLSERVSSLIESGKIVVTLGGEHSITEGPVKAYAKHFRDLSVLQIDAHADLRDTFGGTKYSHACAARRVIEYCPLVQVGIRSVAPDERARLNTGPVKTFMAHEHPMNDETIKKVLKCLSPNVYITIDLDGFDPSVMPAVGTPVPGGLSWYEGLNLIRSVVRERNVVGFDVMELCPSPYSIISDFAAAKLIYRMMGYIHVKDMGKRRGGKCSRRK